MWLCAAWMDGSPSPSNSRGRADMCSYRLIQRRQVLVSFLFSTVNKCESSGSRRTDARRVGGVPRFRELTVDFGEEGGRALAEGLMAPREKPLVQSAARWLLRRSLLIVFAMMRMSSSESALSLALRDADDSKRVGSVKEPNNSSASEAARERLSSNSL